MHRNWTELIRPNVIKVDQASLTGNYGKFEATPLEKGMGVTIGNSLRRILLSTLQGASIYAVKIDGVLHEFSTIKDVVEDVSDIILNLKELRIRLNKGSTATGKISIRGERRVTGKDVGGDSAIEVLNPEHHIATCSSDNAKLDMELYIKMGKGYINAEENKDPNFDVGVIPIDSIFSPIKRVNYKVLDQRVGQKTDYDKLVLEVWTDGTLKPEDAVGYAAKILKEQLTVFINFEETKEDVKKVHERKEESKNELVDALYKKVDELELSVRSANCLQNANITFIGELVQKTESEMLKTKNFGRKSLNEIKEILGEMGLNLGMKVENWNPPSESDKIEIIKENEE